MDLKEKVRVLPSVPGVYLMKDSLGGIIYVGKSKNLKNRVGSYFQNIKSRTPKVEKLIKNLKDFEYITTDTEFEAFMLECALIRDLKPRYNRLMKNPLSYTYIKIELGEKYPSIETSSTDSEKEHTLYFGPYTNKNATEKAIQCIKDFYKINCNCNHNNGTSCLSYSLDLCIGMCLKAATTTKQYENIIHKVIVLLDGTDNTVLKEIEEKMLIASEEFDFETAAKYRDYIASVTYLANNRKFLKFAEENKNIVMIESLNEHLIKLFLINKNNVIFSQTYNIKGINVKQLNEIIKISIIHYFKTSISSPIEVNKDEIDEIQIIHSYLQSSSCNYITISENLLDLEYNSELDALIAKLLII
ncbi:DNA helicase UvrC [Clostridium beijerinckii]|nr:DNA helicase UvrC [Clostridium beijerinckii]